MIEIEIVSFCAIFVFMVIVFLGAQFINNNSIVDIFWGIGFVIVSVLTFVLYSEYNPRQLLLNFLVWIWGMRLSVHIYIRNKGRGEDFRYVKFREKWGNFPRLGALLQVFFLQGLVMFVLIQPVLAVNYFSESLLNGWDVLGMLAFVIGFAFESVSDYQLLIFKRNPLNKNKIMNRGLWQYSRHPNYFGEILVWWGIYLISCSSEYGYWFIASPALITWLLIKVSGIPMLEEKYTHHSEYQEYSKKVSPIFPKP